MENGHVDISSGTLLDDVAGVSCEAGYDLIGDTSLLCQDSGWTGNVSCIAQGMYKFYISFINLHSLQL